jgi:hypothetical protein
MDEENSQIAHALLVTREEDDVVWPSFRIRHRHPQMSTAIEDAAMRQMLTASGIDDDDIRREEFTGY